MFFSRRSLSSVVCDSISSTVMEVVIMTGATVLLNKYRLERCLKIFIISCLPEVNPPEAPPKALPKVEVIISTLPITLQ